MMIHLQLAERSLGRGGDPRPDLAEALKDLGHTAYFRYRDYLGEVLNLQARVEQARGLDPRPTLADALGRMQPLLAPNAKWTLWETAAESWHLRAAWEAAHGLDAQASLQQSRAAVDRALAINPRSGTGHALKGLDDLLAARLQPSNPGHRLAQARQQLLIAQSLDPTGRLVSDLRQSLMKAVGEHAIAKNWNIFYLDVH
jgi:hypothetical protein